MGESSQRWYKVEQIFHKAAYFNHFEQLDQLKTSTDNIALAEYFLMLPNRLCYTNIFSSDKCPCCLSDPFLVCEFSLVYIPIGAQEGNTVVHL